MSPPAPMTPPDADLRGLPYMPLDLVRLFDSDLYALSTGDEFKAALTLWGKAFLQIPAGSLPDDDRVLAVLSGAGPRWKKLKPMALRGFVKCLDGRLYHPTLAEKVKDAWEARLKQRARTEAAREAKLSRKGQTAHAPPVTQSVTEPVTTSVTESVTSPVTESVTGSKGREGKGREEDLSRSDTQTHPRATPPGTPPPSARASLMAKAWQAIGVPDATALPPNLAGTLAPTLEGLIAEGCDWAADIAPALAKRPGDAWPSSPSYWATIARGNRAQRLAAGPSAAVRPADDKRPASRAEAEGRAEAWLRGTWFADQWGPPPGEPGCTLPAKIADAALAKAKGRQAA